MRTPREGVESAGAAPRPCLFVYGTLRSDAGHEMHAVLLRRAEPEGRGSVAGRLYDLGAFPGAVPVSGETPRVRGELYRLQDPGPALGELDAYEGCGPDDPPPHTFRRGGVEVTLDTGARVSAWIYWFEGPVGGARILESGDFVDGR